MNTFIKENIDTQQIFESKLNSLNVSDQPNSSDLFEKVTTDRMLFLHRLDKDQDDTSSRYSNNTMGSNFIDKSGIRLQNSKGSTFAKTKVPVITITN